MKYGKEYYTTNNYGSYLDRADRYKLLANETLNLLTSIGRSTDVVLDYGCAVGFLVDALMDEGIDAYGYDISKWASKQARKLLGDSILSQPPSNEYDLVYYLDVLEHIESSELEKLFETLKPETFVFRIPVCYREGGSFILRVSEKDPTHITRWTRYMWRQFFIKYGYTVLPITLNTIYDTEGVFCGIGIKN